MKSKKNKRKYNKIKNSKSRKKKRNIKGGKLCASVKDSKDTYTISDEFARGTHVIYNVLDKPNMLVKVIDAQPNFFKYKSKRINYEIDASKLAYLLGVGPEIYYAKKCEFGSTSDGTPIVGGFIVMEKINGKVLESDEEINKYIDKIYNKYQILVESNNQPMDIHAKNIMISYDTDDIFIIDYDDYDKDKVIYSKEELKEILLESLISTIS